MIVPPEDKSISKSNLSPPSEAGTVMADASPPAYEPPQSIAPPDIKPSNYISLTRRLGEVKGTFVLDPTLHLPPSMQVPNNKLHLSLSALMGEVAAVVYVVGSAAASTSKTRMEVTSTMGTTRLEIHAPDHRAPISVSVSARLGEAILLLPRSFRGPLNVSATLGEITISSALRAGTVMFGDRMFVGHWTEEEVKQKAWAGDEASISSSLGTVYVGYDDDEKKK
ncbi:hypothetical protein C8R47DRAFT_1138877 [Mycena vitilis]|nr:hypothetical protein C8R47DRAFT_1138877 [Mycena vitilis]